MDTKPQYVIVTPVRDEVSHVEAFVRAVQSQTFRPLRWIVVDDGSQDGTGALLDRLGCDIPWMHVLHLPNRGYRANGGGVMDAFYAGYAIVANDSWDFIVKLDGDLVFDSNYFQLCFTHFANDPALGIGGGTVYTAVPGGTRTIESRGDPPFHVRGATKMYRRACWEVVSPLMRAPGWDTIDEVKANMLGWRTRTFPDAVLLQQKPTGSADGRWRNAFKNGRANYVAGYDPLFMAVKCARRALSSPPLLIGVALASGFLTAHLRRLPRVSDAGVVSYIRHQQRRRLLLRPSIYG